MGCVRQCTREDVVAAADMHVKLRFGLDSPGSEALRQYYSDMFFNNPWVDPGYPSWVYENSDGRITGFIGTIHRVMRFEGKPIHLAIGHRLMVDAEADSPVAAISLVQSFMSGEQDVSLTDGANRVGYRIWKAMGAEICRLYSMNWMYFMRPLAMVGALAGKKSKVLRGLELALRPVTHLVDNVLVRRQSSGAEVPEGSCERVDSSGFLEHLTEISAGFRLTPEYDPKSMAWLWSTLKSNRFRGDFDAVLVRNKRGESIGACLFYVGTNRVAEVLHLSAKRSVEAIVFNTAIKELQARGVVGVFGRLEPRFLECLWERNCIIKKGSWTMVMARDRQLVDCLNRGDGMVSALEGELWLRSPRERM